jgi:curved DNA-binding protein CbpA
MKDYYRILEVHPEASPEMISRAYKTLAKKYHPDQYHISDKRLLTERMQAINEAYETLADPSRRQRYNHRYQDFIANQPGWERQVRCQQYMRNFIYWFLVGILVMMLFRGFLSAFLLNPVARIVIIGFAVILVIRLWKRQR